MNIRLFRQIGWHPEITTLPSPATRRKGVSVPLWAVIATTIVLTLLVDRVLL